MLRFYRAITCRQVLAAAASRSTFYKTSFREFKMTCVIPNSLQSFGVVKGQIQVIFGPMFSGKTTELIRRLKRYQIANYRCLIVRYANDNRFRTDSIATHDNQTLPAVSATKLEDLRLLSHDYDVIGIDEGQFFVDCVDYAETMANNGKIVIVAALDGTFQRVGFGDILNLVPLSESVVKLTAVCMSCFSDASYTKRISNEKQVEIIGGVDKYMAVCRQCHAQASPQKRSPFKEVNQEVSPAKAPRKNLFENGKADENCCS